MATHHPSVHTFSKKVAESSAADTISNFYHIGIKCEGCSKESFNGKRYKCEQCPSSYNLCENCYGKEHTHHKFKYIQHSALHAHNQQMLGRRTLDVAQNNDNRNWRDPITGWTKSDAEQVIQQGKQEQQIYENRLQEVHDRDKRALEDSKRRLQQTIDDHHRWMMWNL